MSIWAWIRKALGFEILDRVDRLEARMKHNQESTQGAIDAFKQFAKDAER